MIIELEIDNIPLCDLGRLGFAVVRMVGEKAHLRPPDYLVFPLSERKVMTTIFSVGRICYIGFSNGELLKTSDFKTLSKVFVTGTNNEQK